MKGQGSVFFDAHRDRWVGVLDVGRRPDGRRVRRKVTGATRAEVARRLRQLAAARDAGLPVADGGTTLKAFCEEWVTHVLPGRATVGSPNTVANYRQVLATHVLPVLGGRRLRDLRVEDVEGVLRSMAARGYSRSTVARVRAVLVMALTHAERRGLLARNVARLAEMPACRPPAERRALTFEEARRLLDAAAGDRLGAMWVTGLLLGLRPGELTGLCWEDVDLDAGVLHVRRALRRLPDGTLAFGPLKTARSRRSLDMPAPVVEALRRHRAAMAAERLAAGGAWPERWAGLVFVSEAGTALDPSNLRRHFERVCAAAGVGRLRPYELRHSAASLLSAAGVHAEVVGDVLGHDGTRMVAQVYRHAVAPTVRAAAETWERVLGGGGR